MLKDRTENKAEKLETKTGTQALKGQDKTLFISKIPQNS